MSSLKKGKKYIVSQLGNFRTTKKTYKVVEVGPNWVKAKDYQNKVIVICADCNGKADKARGIYDVFFSPIKVGNA